MLFFLAYLAVRRLVRVFGEGSAVAALEVENALLRHQLAVLRRTVKRPPLRRDPSAGEQRAQLLKAH